MIMALARFEIAPKGQVKVLEKDWAKYREEHELDHEGTPRGISIHTQKSD